MAQGDVKDGLLSIAPGGTYDIKPGTGEEWSIHNIYFGGAVEIYKTDGTNFLKFDSDTSFGGRLNGTFNLTEFIWIQIKNTDSVNILVGHDGRQVK